jgi:Tol biopolymer transport system component
MPLSPGTRLGPYEIVAPLGAGGMGEVYRAKDTRLGRDVAVKVLPAHLSENSEVRARFEREARAVSQLAHPNICVLHDVGREGATDYIVMEHLEGEALASRLLRGPLPMEEVLAIGTQVADALDKAHRAGIVHRDLKPGNVMLTRSGAKLLDFGLARAPGLATTVTDLTSSPTVAQPLTTEGTILGTFHYMAPEQLEGAEADARADLWALGCVLYEMATGRRPFNGRSQASLIAAILEKPLAPIAEAQPLAPPALDRLVRSLLAKDPAERVQTAHDVKLQLRWIAEGGSQAGVPAPMAARRRGRERLAWALAGVAALAALAVTVLLLLRPREAPRVVRFEIEAPRGARGLQWPRLSHDGRTLAFIAADTAGTPRIWLRALDALESVPVAGTEGAGRVFWSPDDRYLAFIGEGKVRRVPVAGGASVAIGDAPGGSDGSWGAGGVIAYDGGAGDSIRGVPVGGGAVRALTTMGAGTRDGMQGWPAFLPDGKRFLFVGYETGGSRSGMMRIGRLGSMEARDVGATDGRVEYTPEGWIVFPRENTLLAQRFDPRSGRTRGEAMTVGEDVSLGAGNGDFSITGNGVLVYRTQRTGVTARLVWVDRNGGAMTDAAPPGPYHELALAPDGRRVALGRPGADGGGADLWIRELDRGVTSRLTFDPGEDINPVWSPDGLRIAFSSDRRLIYRTWVRLASGVGAEDTLGAAPAGPSGPTGWSRDGATLLLRTRTPDNGWDVQTLAAAGGVPPRPFVSTPFMEQWGRMSPDGRWIAYMSDESGRGQVYVRAADGSGGKWQVSVNGGTLPQWRADGGELFFQAPDQTILAVSIQPGASFSSGMPVPLFRLPLVDATLGGYRWTPASDAKRFLVLTPAGGEERARFTVVLNWTAGLERR